MKKMSLSKLQWLTKMKASRKSPFGLSDYTIKLT